mmetsp:Transcript_37590/g.75762  ORF Transcript_37590/g.75762 Transcript_37590/m.75762 type:complete len:430 (-) Transcript_37590:18-1307(-)
MQTRGACAHACACARELSAADRSGVPQADHQHGDVVHHALPSLWIHRLVVLPDPVVQGERREPLGGRLRLLGPVGPQALHGLPRLHEAPEAAAAQKQDLVLRLQVPVQGRGLRGDAAGVARREVPQGPRDGQAGAAPLPRVDALAAAAAEGDPAARPLDALALLAEAGPVGRREQLGGAAPARGAPAEHAGAVPSVGHGQPAAPAVVDRDGGGGAGLLGVQPALVVERGDHGLRPPEGLLQDPVHLAAVPPEARVPDDEPGQGVPHEVRHLVALGPVAVEDAAERDVAVHAQQQHRVLVRAVRLQALAAREAPGGRPAGGPLAEHGLALEGGEAAGVAPRGEAAAAGSAAAPVAQHLDEAPLGEALEERHVLRAGRLGRPPATSPGPGAPSEEGADAGAATAVVAHGPPPSRNVLAPWDAPPRVARAQS